MGGDAHTFGEDLDGAGGDPHFDLAAGEPVRNTVVVAIGLDVVIDADAVRTPFGEDMRLGRQRFERRPIELLAACGVLRRAGGSAVPR
jgi:hypothetical protein